MFYQERALKKYFPDSQTNRKADLEISWEGNINPTPLSTSYKIKLYHKRGFSPKIYVLSPQPLPLAAGKKELPHVYSQTEQRLCLYYPVNKEWNESKYYVQTLIPWASEWLMHYEIWVATGNWTGGGIEHPKED